MSLSLPPPNSAGSRCWYALIELSDEDREQLDGWLRDHRIDGGRIARALEAHGVDRQQVQRHRANHLGAKPCR